MPGCSIRVNAEGCLWGKNSEGALAVNDSLSQAISQT